MDLISTPADAERHLAATADALTAPAPGECVFCYVARMLTAFGCDTTLRFALRWRDIRMPRATGLEGRLNARGGFCDCEIFLNGWEFAAEREVPDDDGDLCPPAVPPPCAGGRGSQPCAHWQPRRRARW